MAGRRSPLYDAHERAGATFTEFGGWDMPVEFDSITTEHEAVREDVGIFDVSHMGQIEVTGPEATSLLDRSTTNDVTALDVGDAQYAAITDDDGVMVDDTIVYRLPDESGDPAFLFVPNAGADEATIDRFRRYRDQWGLDATLDNRTEDYGMVAIQGPRAIEVVADAADDPDVVTDLSRFEIRDGTVAGVEMLVSRTGYTGEDGVELLVSREDVETVWSAFVDESTEATSVSPCGLGARDTLRLEAGYLLSGQDFHPESNPRNPYEAGIGFAVDIDTDFVGRDALAAVADSGPDERLVGFTLLDRGVPRHGYDVVDEHDGRIGMVTSGTVSPTLGEPIGLAYVPVEFADPGTEIGIDVRGRTKHASVEGIPFVHTVQ